MTDSEIVAFVSKEFVAKGVRPKSIEIRNFPGERIVIVEVVTQLNEAMILASALDGEIEDGFITVRLAKNVESRNKGTRVADLKDPRLTRLIELLGTRSRTSEAQPSLRYIEDVKGRLQIAQSHRHQLIFGRRGAGKTALMLEAKKKVEDAGAVTIWANIQTLRNLGANKAFAHIGIRLCDLVESHFSGRKRVAKSSTVAVSIRGELDRIISKKALESSFIEGLVPKLQSMISLFAAESQTNLYLFLDDLHYLPYNDVPIILDLIHGISRDTPTWIKAAGIKHQMRWFRDNPPIGLQLGHDAVELNLDITLQEPERANKFLQQVLDSYVDECDAAPRRAFLGSEAIDRLVLASGGVPRDFFTLGAAAIQVARKRVNARTVGLQDINEAAGNAAKAKLEELEEDAAGVMGGSKNVLAALNKIREFLIDDNKTVFFRLEFRDKEINPDPYSLIERLTDLRMLHLINSSLSDPHHAGVRYEVYLLDLSEYSGSRLKRNLSMLDFKAGSLRLRRTGGSGSDVLGTTPLKMVSILRSGPIFDLMQLAQ
jgi:hypothetical protein